MELKVRKLDPKAILPAYATPGSAGADLYALPGSVTVIAPGETVFIHTGIAAAVPEGHVGLVYARSSLAAKRGLAPANKVGVIDSDYRGEIMVALLNHSKEAQTVEGGDRVAQLVITPVLRCDISQAEELDDTSRGSGGFGSTGV